PGFGPSGGAGGDAASGCPRAFPASTPPNTAQSLPFLGGSGGGGGGGAAPTACAFGQLNGGGGGAGGGAVLLAATTQIAFDGNAALWLFGGDGGSSGCQCFSGVLAGFNSFGLGGGGGIGGNLRLVSAKLLAPTTSSAQLSGGVTPIS